MCPDRKHVELSDLHVLLNDAALTLSIEDVMASDPVPEKTSISLEIVSHADHMLVKACRTHTSLSKAISLCVTFATVHNRVTVVPPQISPQSTNPWVHEPMLSVGDAYSIV